MGKKPSQYFSNHERLESPIGRGLTSSKTVGYDGIQDDGDIDVNDAVQKGLSKGSGGNRAFAPA